MLPKPELKQFVLVNSSSLIFGQIKKKTHTHTHTETLHAVIVPQFP